MRWVMGHVVAPGSHVAFAVCVCAYACVACSYIDVVKGIAMFDKLKVPTLALVENMSYFECEHGTKYHPFGVLRVCSEARRHAPVLSVLHPCPRR